MENKENKWLMFLMLAVIYAVVLGVMLTIFNLFTEEKTSTINIIFQSIFFGIFMCGFEYWQYKRKNKKQ